MKFPKEACDKKKKKTHTHTHTHIYIYTLLQVALIKTRLSLDLI